MDCVDRIRSGDPVGIEELYRAFAPGIRFFVSRHLGRDEAEDRVHDALVLIVEAIRRGDLRDPACLGAYVCTVVRHLVAAHIGRLVEARGRRAELELAAQATGQQTTPEQEAVARQQIEIMRDVLARLSARDREILTRFYLLEQSKQQICTVMGLSETQFRLLKSRAKARFGKLGRLRITTAVSL